MTEQSTQPASAEPIEPKPAQSLEVQAQPKDQPPEDAFDKERAMETIRKLRDIEKQYHKDQKEFERLKAEEQKRLDAQLSEAERLKKERDELATRAANLELSMLRRDVISETGLPAVFAERLKGSTKDEMLEDAKKLMEALPKTPKAVQAAINPGAASPNETDAQKRERLFGPSGVDIFNVEKIEKMGGGVVMLTKE